MLKSNRVIPSEPRRKARRTFWENWCNRADAPGRAIFTCKLLGKAGGEVAFPSGRSDFTRQQTFPTRSRNGSSGRIKFLARLKNLTRNRCRRIGRIDHARSRPAANDIRVATYPTVTGEKIVLRLFNSSTAKKLNELDFPEHAHAELEHFSPADVRFAVAHRASRQRQNHDHITRACDF